MTDTTPLPVQDEPTSTPPGGGSWEWVGGAWRQIEAPARRPADKTDTQE